MSTTTLIILGVGGFALLIVVAIVLFIVGGRGEEEDEDEVPAGGEGYDGAKTMLEDGDRTQQIGGEGDTTRARKSRMIALKESFESSLQTRGGPKQSTRDRLSLPWFMLVGADGSGKKSLLANTGLPLPYGPPFEVDATKRDAGRWWLFEDAVVLEAPPATTQAEIERKPTDSTVTDPHIAARLASWNNLLGLLRRERPDSPLNGIIVTVSCEDLVGSRRRTPEEVGEQAERIRDFLERTKLALGCRLPVHLLITKCDVMPGFKSFAKCVPEKRRNDMLGWVNAHRLESSFQITWIEEGFSALKRELADLHDELLGSPERINTHDADGLFVFMNEFAEIQDSLRDFVTHLMPINEARPSFFFRGMYFTGDTVDHAGSSGPKADLNAGATMKLSAEIALGDKAEAHNLVFLRSLFADKIFKEAGLARPLARFTLSRDRRVIALQAATVVLTLIGTVGLVTSVSGFRRGPKSYKTGLRADAAGLTQVLGSVAIDLDEVKQTVAASDTAAERRTRDAAAIELVGQLRDAATIRVRSPFLPTSWFSPLPGEVRKSLLVGLENVVMPVSRQRLMERSAQLLGTPLTNVANANGRPPADLDPSDPHSIIDYLTDVHALSRNIDRYDMLATAKGDPRDLSALLDYLFGERPFTNDSNQASGEFTAAIRTAKAQKIDVTPVLVHGIVARALGTVRQITDSAARQLSSAPPSAKPDEDVGALRRLYELSQLLDPKTGIVPSVSDSSILGVKLARMLQDSVAAELNLAAVRIARDTVPLDRAGQRLRSVLGRLFQQRFMEKGEGRAVSADLHADQKLRWDLGRLELVLALRGEYNQAPIIVGDAVAAPVKARLQKSLETQLRMRAVDVAASAERFVPDSAAAFDPVAELLAAGANLDAASLRITRVAKFLDTLGAVMDGRRLVAVGARMAERQLALAQLDFDRHRYFAPQTGKIAAWPGGFPIGFAALGAADSAGFGAALLGPASPVTAVVTLGHGVAPALRYLKSDSTRFPKLTRDWEGIAASVQKLDAQDPTGSLQALTQFIQQQMSAMSMPACQAAAAKADTVKASDVFLVRRREFRAAMLGRCATGGLEATATYEKLRTMFQAQLAGRFPFSDPGRGARASDADPALVRDFLRVYDSFASNGELALRSDPRYAESGKAAFGFLDQIAQARAFLATYVDSGVTRKSPEFTLIVRRAKGVDTTGAEMLEVAGRGLPIDADDHEESWRFGDSFVLSRGRPGSSEMKQEFSADGGWSVLQYVMQRPAAKELIVRFFHPDTKIELQVPTFPTSAPEIGKK